MLNLRFWLNEQRLSVRELALRLELPPATVEDWVYRGAVPNQVNITKLDDFIKPECTHYWVIAAADGPVSLGGCQKCGEERGFMNSAEVTPWFNPASSKSTGDSATYLKN